jgi:acetyltransferase-like isoleucine patch superfamily enzyme
LFKFYKTFIISILLFLDDYLSIVRAKLLLENKTKSTRIYKPLFCNYENLHLSDNVIIGRNARVEGISKRLGIKYSPTLKIGQNTTFEQCLHISYAGFLEIGSNCTFSSNIFMSDCNHIILNDKSTRKTDLVVELTKIGNNCFFGVGCKILPGAIIGNNVIFGAGSVILPGCYPSNSRYAGVPVRKI